MTNHGTTSAARELALEEAEHAVGSTVLKHKPSDYDGLDSLEAYEAGQLNGLESAQASLRTLGTSREQLNKAVSNVPDQQENEPGAHGERERALEEAAKIAEQFRNNDWIAHDMRTGVFPTQSEPGIAIAAAIRALSSPDHADAGKVEGDGSAAARDVLAERRRQIEAKGWTPEHDNQFVDRELAKAAACYAIDNAAMWPWSMSWWKPSNSRRNLVKAGALILAEIERLDRLPSAPSQEVAGS